MVMAGYHTRSHARPWLPQTHRKHQWRSPLPRLWAQGCRAEPRHARLRSLRRSCPQSVHQIRCSAAPAIERTGKPPQTDGTLAHLHMLSTHFSMLSTHFSMPSTHFPIARGDAGVAAAGPASPPAPSTFPSHTRCPHPHLRQRLRRAPDSGRSLVALALHPGESAEGHHYRQDCQHPPSSAPSLWLTPAFLVCVCFPCLPACLCLPCLRSLTLRCLWLRVPSGAVVALMAGLGPLLHLYLYVADRPHIRRFGCHLLHPTRQHGLEISSFWAGGFFRQKLGIFRNIPKIF